MPSPFPGMDPYLEDPFLWPGFHSLIVAEIMVGLNRLILPDYRADIEERVYISDEDDTARKFIIPDVCHTFRRGHRVVVHVQSSWFPLVDRNPQTFVNIPTAKPEDFRKATQHIHRSANAASGLQVQVLPPRKP